MNRDIVCGCGTFVFAVAYYLTAAAIPESMLADAVGPQGLPEAYGIALAILSLLLVGSGYLLYYVADERWRLATSTLHWVLGLAALVPFLVHLFRGRIHRDHDQRPR